MVTEIQRVERELPDRKQVSELATRIKRFMPGGNRLSNEEALSGAQIALSRGLDPFSNAYVFKDKYGNVVVKEKYTVNIEWAQRQSPYNKRFARLIDAAATEEGLDKNDVAYYCYLMRRDRIPDLSAMTQAGYPTELALQMVEVRGIGVVDTTEMSKRKPPQGRTWAWVAQKRAEADAIKQAYGEPNQEDMRAMRWEVNEEDYDGTEALAHDDARALAKFRAQQREPALTDEQLPEAQVALFGDDVVEGEYSEETTPEAPPAPASDDGPDFEDGSEEAPPRPYAPADLRGIIRDSIIKVRAKNYSLGDKRDNFRFAVVANLEACFEQHKDQGRHLVTEYLTGKASSKDLDDAEIKVLHKWLDAHPIDSGEWVVNQFSQQEGRMVARQALEDAGQGTLFDDNSDDLVIELPVYSEMGVKELQDHVSAVLMPLIREKGLSIEGYKGAKPSVDWLANVWAALQIAPTLKI